MYSYTPNLNYPSIVGRISELNELEKFYTHNKTGLLVVYGRRRIGKTYLIKEFCKQKSRTNSDIYFKVTGVDPEKNDFLKSKASQIKNFLESIHQTFKYDYSKIPLAENPSWDDVFKILKTAIDSQPKDKKILIFIDEFPYFCSQDMSFLIDFQRLWNNDLDDSDYSHVKVMVAGSATGFILKNFVFSKKGMYKRGHPPILLNPFTLKEAKDYSHFLGRPLLENEIIKLYSVFGGVAEYLEKISLEPSHYLADDLIEQLIFKALNKDYFQNEFDLLLKSSFGTGFKDHKKVILKLAKSKSGMSREEIIEKCDLPNNESTTELLRELEFSSLIYSFAPLSFDKRTKGKINLKFKLKDEFCRFHQYWIDERQIVEWKVHVGVGDYHPWAGDIFEKLIEKHSGLINSKLGFNSSYKACWWREKKDRKYIGPEIDLVVRPGKKFNTPIYVIEAKYSNGIYVSPSGYQSNLEKKLKAMVLASKNPQTPILLVVVTLNGVSPTDNELQALKHKGYKVKEDLTAIDLFY